jgi:hypothetical protein
MTLEFVEKNYFCFLQLKTRSCSEDDGERNLVPYILEDGTLLLSRTEPLNMSFSRIELYCLYCEQNRCREEICEKNNPCLLEELIRYW